MVNREARQGSGVRRLEAVESGAFALLLVLGPLAYGAAPLWAFAGSLWLGLGALLAMVLRRLWQEERLLPASVLDAPFGLLLAVAAVSLIGSIHRYASLWALLRLGLYAAVFYVTLDVARSRQGTKRLFYLLLCMGLVVAFLGLVEYAGAPFPEFWKINLSDGLDSTFVNRNHTAGFLSMAFLLALGVLVCRTTESAVILGSSALVIFVAFCLCLSRGGWIGAIVAVEFLLVGYLLRRQVSGVKIGFLTVGLVLFTVLLFLGSNSMIKRAQTLQNIGSEPSWSSRVEVWKASAHLIGEKPWVGSGPGTFPWAFPRVRPAGLDGRYEEAHNDYVQIVTEMGLPVMVPLIWGILVIFRVGLRRIRRTLSRLRAGVTLGALAGIVAILVHSVSDFNIQITSNGVLFSCLVGLVLARME